MWRVSLRLRMVREQRLCCREEPQLRELTPVARELRRRMAKSRSCALKRFDCRHSFSGCTR